MFRIARKRVKCCAKKKEIEKQIELKMEEWTKTREYKKREETKN